MLTREYAGLALTWQRITPGDTVTKVSSGVWKYVEYTLNFDSGSTAVAAGDVIVGATSGATAIVLELGTLTGGTWAGGDAAGPLRIKSVCGTFQNSENLNYAANANFATVDGTASECTNDYAYKGLIAKGLLAVAETQAQRIMFDANGGKPDQTSDLGIGLRAGYSIMICDGQNMANLYTVDATSGSTGSLICVGFF